VPQRCARWIDSPGPSAKVKTDQEPAIQGMGSGGCHRTAGAEMSGWRLTVNGVAEQAVGEVKRHDQP
jgi:hypothetical protein